MPKRKKIVNKVTPFKNGGGKITVTFNAADEEPATIQIYEDIGEDPWTGGFSAQDFADALKDIPRSKPIDLRINSAGGNVWDGLAIKTLLDEWPARKTASIDGMAASVASWIPMGVDEIRAPRHAQMFIHPAWALVSGYADDLRKNAADLDKTSDQIADIYARKTGMSSAECRDLMNAETLMTAEEAHGMGFIDRLTDDQAIQNFSDKQLTAMKSKLAVLNSIKSAPSQGAGNHQPQDDTMNRKNMTALLNKWGVKFEDKATDDEILELVLSSAPKNKKNDDDDTDVDGDGDKHPTEHNDDDGGDQMKDGSNPNADCNNRISRLEAAAKRAEAAANKLIEENKKAQRQHVTNRVKACIENGLPAAQLNEWIEDALKATDTDKFLNRLEAMEFAQPGVAPVSAEVGEASSIEDLNQAMTKLNEVQDYYVRNRSTPDLHDRMLIGENSQQKMALVNRLKKIEKTKNCPSGELVGPLRQMWDAWSSQPRSMSPRSPRNANTMDSGLLRQVIMSEIMRAFRREFASLDFFSHIYQNVPLEGTNVINVPYYPLDTTASTEFLYSNGYVTTPNAVTNSKSITVGGKGDGVATSGSGRKYKPLQFTAYEVRRQPWLNIAQLTVMAGEQLAIDVRADIIGTNVSKANFGSAIWTGLAGGFDHTVVTQYLLNAAIKAFWPMGMRYGLLAPDYYTALAGDPNLSRFLEAGSDETLRQGIVGKLYGFKDITYDALIPVANFIRGGDGTLTNGADPNLAGFIAYPSSILIATAPIMPPPGVMKLLVGYEQVTDDQTGLSFTYQFFGDVKANADNEIIECTYGSNTGELAALKRLTSIGT
jgi:ATP-dependent protease ClpP protease subunit